MSVICYLIDYELLNGFKNKWRFVRCNNFCNMSYQQAKITRIPLHHEK